MLEVTDLPTVNAILNSLAALCLLAGYWFIRHNDIKKHRAAMIGALIASTLFLFSYLVYHYNVGSKPFEGVGAIRVIYFTILISHTILAMVIVPMVFVTLFRALKERFDKHRRIARWTLPLWLYVSATGVIIYLMLYGV